MRKILLLRNIERRCARNQTAVEMVGTLIDAAVVVDAARVVVDAIVGVVVGVVIIGTAATIATGVALAGQCVCGMAAASPLHAFG